MATNEELVERMRESGRAYLAKKKKSSSSWKSLTREEIAEIESRTAAVASKKSLAEQKAELARIEKKLSEEKKAAEEKVKASEKAAEQKAAQEAKAKQAAKAKAEILQQQYILSLKQKSGTTAEIQPYTGVTFPLGSKDVTWQEPTFGTVTPETTSGFKEISMQQILREQEVVQPDVSKPVEVIYQQQADRIGNKIAEEELTKAQKVIDDSVNKIQTKIDSGDISLERGQEAIDRIVKTENRKLQTNISTRFEKELSAAQAVPSFKTKIEQAEKFRKGFEAVDPRAIKEKKKQQLILAADIAAAAVSIAAPPVGIAYFTGKGLYGAGKGRKEDIRMADVDPITGELLTPRYMGEIPSERTREAGVNLLFGGLSGIGAAEKSGQILRERAAALIKQRWTVLGKEITKEGDEQVLKVYASKTVGGASAEAELTLPIKVTKDGRFQILAGRGRTETRVLDYAAQGKVPTGKDIIKGSLDFNVFGKGAIKKGIIKTNFGGIELENIGLKVTQGEGYISPDTLQNIMVQAATKRRWISPRPFDVARKPILEITADVMPQRAEHFLIGGVAKKGKAGVTEFVSGEITKARLYPWEKRFTGLFKPGAVGKIVKGEPKESFKTFGGKIVGKKGKGLKPLEVLSAKTEAEVIGRQATPGILSTAEKTTIKTLKIAPDVASRTILSTAPVISQRTAQIIDTTSKLKDKFGVGVKTDVGLSSKSISQGLETSPLVGVKPVTDVSFKPSLRKGVSQRGLAKQVTDEVVISPSPITASPRARAPVPSSPETTLSFGFERPKPQVVRGQGWRASVLKEATKGKKATWVEQKTPPLTRESALSSGARQADSEIGARFKIKKVKDVVSGTQQFTGKIQDAISRRIKPKVGVIDTKDKYYADNKKKFRMWRQKSKKRKATPNQFIERQKYRIDSPQEKRTLAAAKGVGGFIGKVSNPKQKAPKKFFRL